MVVSESESRMKRLAAYLPDSVYEELEQWAGEDKRSLSNLVAFLLEQAIVERRKELKQQEPDSKNDSK
ncbi:hypothetical protein K9N68_10795 [Kovacikia minuta CCNUW1]|uniref:ribbon-helix-helix domain-containing protein n=1 Tax=Kovacikia minuta TaxID=2931930 RepID=UPI001CCD1609|nr:hypothetical protein [Kovacikia minuta]UBF28316.1 hypothetical protein K9N68_10795 [Kovacikia minuta CCNUW1]